MTPVFGLLLLLPVPFIFLMYTGNEELKLRTFLPLIIFLVPGAIIAPENALIFALYAVAAPLILLAMNRRGVGPSWKTLLCASLPASALYAVMLLLSPETVAGMQADIAGAIGQYYESVVLTDAQRLEGQQYLLYEMRDRYAAAFVSLSPALILSLLMFIYYFTGKIYFRPPLNRITEIPDFVLLFPVCAGICMLLQRAELFVPGAAMLLICGTLYFCRGFDITWFYMSRWKLFLLFKAAVVFCIVFYPPVQAGIAVLGLVSVFANLIREDRPEEEGEKS